MACDVCMTNPEIGFAAIPMVPMSCAFCVECIQSGAIPWDIAVANTWCCGGLDECNDEWKEIVKATCTRLGKTLDQFTQEVQQMLDSEPGPYQI